jgi:hypothetical protein
MSLDLDRLNLLLSLGRYAEGEKAAVRQNHARRPGSVGPGRERREPPVPRWRRLRRRRSPGGDGNYSFTSW